MYACVGMWLLLIDMGSMSARLVLCVLVSEFFRMVGCRWGS